MVNINLPEYLGVWHEIASVPAWFSKGCRDTTAQYTDRGKFVEVKNACTIKVCDDKGCVNVRKEKIGKATTTPDPSLLQVSFSIFAPKAPYKILDAKESGGAYQTAIVQSGKYLWFLTRDPSPKNDTKTFAQLQTTAKTLGVDTSQLLRTR